ncbi:MAG: carboxypeptidase-like regulatory domain-containing protein [Candidatus Solibacter sp.]
MKRITNLVTLIAVLAMGSFAQDNAGNIRGTVLDASGSTVAGAKVTVTNTDRNQVLRTLTTDVTGSYSALILPVGTYAIRVEAKGFKTEDRTGIVLNVSDDLRHTFNLQVGAITETVEVKADAVSVELGTPASATTIEGTQVRELSLGSRNYEQLVALMPGVASNAVDELYVGNTAPGGAANTIPFAINGARTSANNWTVDGADNVDRGSNLTLQTFPSVDAIAQFKVERSLYTADSGRAGGGQINVVTKGGTSRFHGGAYEFFRNDKLNANTWSNNANRVSLYDTSDPFHNCTTNYTANCTSRIAPVRWNNFGFTLGGPVSLLGYNKQRNKTFFFYSQEWRKVISYNTFNPILPTKGMLTGNMLQPVCLTTTTGCATGAPTVTQIPTNLISANAAAYIKDIFSKLPLLDGATTTATTAGFFPVKNEFYSRQEMFRIDHQINERFNLWGRVTIDDIPTKEPSGLFLGGVVPNIGNTSTNSPGRGVAFHSINIIRPTLVNDAAFNFSQSAITTIPTGLMAKQNSPNINPKEPFVNPLGVNPTLTFTGGSSIAGNGPYLDYNRNYSFSDSLSWIKGRHVVKFGYNVNRYNKTENANGNAIGTFAFSAAGAPTGTSTFQQSWANFLLGNVATFTQSSQDLSPDVWAWQHEAYVQDDFKVNSRLTLYLGVRWSMFGQPTDSNGQLSNFDPASYDPAKAPKIDPTNGRVIAGTTGWQTNGLIVGGKNSKYGQHIANNNYKNFAPRIGISWDPLGDGKTAIRSGYGIYHDSVLFGIYEQNMFSNPPFVASVTYTNASFNDVSSGTAGIDPFGPLATSVLAPRGTQVPALTPYTQQWSLNIQRQLPQGLVVEVGYFGSKGTHLLGAVDMNAVRPGAALAAGLKDNSGTTAANAPGTTVFTSADWPRINAIRPFKGFNAFTSIQSAFDSNYHSLQVNIRKSFGSAGLIGAAYTFSKTLTDNGSDRSNAAQDAYNWHDGEYGPAPTDRRQVLTINYVYTLPFFKGGRSLMHTAFGGWQLSGILSTYTGQPTTVTSNTFDPAGLGIGNGGPASLRPDQICDPNKGAPHTYAGSAQSSSQGITWFNTACFANVPQGVVRPGNAGRYTVRGPGFFNLDASLMKNFNLSKEGQWKLQMRLETFNTMNWVNPSGFASSVNTATNFGQISSFRAARRVALGAKINF